LPAFIWKLPDPLNATLGHGSGLQQYDFARRTCSPTARVNPAP